MDYYVYIDESGPFKNLEYTESIVGGFITNRSINFLDSEVSKMISNFNKNHNTDFKLKDIHIASLLHPDKAFLEHEKERFIQIDKTKREAFSEACYSLLSDITLKLVASKNIGFDFGEIDQQARYGSTLCAFIHEVINYIMSENNITSLNIMISQRNEVCLPGWKDLSNNPDSSLITSRKLFKQDYHSKMVSYIGEWVHQAIPEINLFIDYNPLECKAGFAMADVACYYLRYDSSIYSKLHVLETKPNKIYVKSFNETEQILLNRLIEKNSFDTAYRWADSDQEKDKVIRALSQSSTESKKASIESLLNDGFYLIDQRTIDRTALSDAISLFKRMMNLTANNQDHKIQELFLCACNGLVICANHCGDKKDQDKALDFYTKAMNSLSNIPYHTRQEKILALRNRAYNQHFNDYRFQDIIDEFEPIVEKRARELPENEKDSLTGEMMGTVGQAYAFLSNFNVTYVQKAEFYFKKSLYNLVPGQKYHQMSVNYLATLKWYHNDSLGAFEAFKLHHNILVKDSPALVLAELVNSYPDDVGLPFKVSMLLRILTDIDTSGKDILEKVWNWAKKLNNNQHPMELIYKYLGIGYLKINEFTKALRCFDTSISISDKLGFTVKTISLSVHGLRSITFQKTTDKYRATLEQNSLELKLKDLTANSISFRKYIDTLGGLERMLKDIKSDNKGSIIRWLPFAYA